MEGTNLLNNEILRETVRKVQHAGKIKELTEEVGCTASFIYWWLERPDRDMRLELANRVFSEAKKLLEPPEMKESEI